VLADLPAPRPPLARAALGRLTQARHAARRRLAGYLQAPRPPTLMLPSGTKDSFTIGRDAACDLVLCDMTVSRSHAGLRREAGGWVLSDAGSMNGTRLNGWRVTEPVPVCAGDEVMFGALTLVVTEHARDRSAAATP
jgi:pSer/pThr/pTyr-binding forkhead associated (FHA) protein